MKAESMVKEQARKVLSNGNWCSAVVTFFVALSVLCFTMIISELVYVFEPSENLDFSNLFIVGLFFSFEVVSVAVMVFLSPVYTGVIRYYNLLAQGKEADISQVFYYLTKERYMCTLSFNISLIGYYIANGIISFIPAIAWGIATSIVFSIYPSTVFAALMMVINVFLIILCAVLFYIVTRKYFAAAYLFVNDDINIYWKDCIKASKLLMKGNTLKPVKLLISFIPWFLLCFFVFPWIYVFPYYNQAKSLSSRWIYELNCGKIKDKVNFQKVEIDVKTQNPKENLNAFQDEIFTDQI